MQQMTANRKSWHYRLNVWMYGTDRIENLTNGCPYFWGTILAIFLVPFKLMGIGLSKIYDKIPEPEFSISEQTSERIAIGVILGLIGLLVSVVTYEILIGNGWQVLKVFVIMVAILGFTYGVAYASKAFHDMLSGRPKREPNQVVQMIKAKKSKYCPRLVFTN